MTVNTVLRLCSRHLGKSDETTLTFGVKNLVDELVLDLRRFYDNEEEYPDFEGKTEPTEPRTDQADMIQMLSRKRLHKLSDLPDDQKLALSELLMRSFIRGTSNFNNKVEADPDSSTHLVTKIQISSGFLEFLFGANYLERRQDVEIFIDRSVPMISWPAPWTRNDRGGYYYTANLMLRVSQTSEQAEAMFFSDLREVQKILTYMAQTPWRVNSQVLDVVSHFYRKGGGVVSIPFVNGDMQFKIGKDFTPAERKHVIKLKSENWSLLSDFEIKLGIAQAFVRNSRFFIPLNMDFRGRIYPISPHLNNIGDDITRGLLEFADAKPLGETGMKWLKIQIANKMGHDKLPLLQRESVVDEYHDDLIRIAEDPYNNTSWFKFEEPWQALGAIFEYYKAVHSPNPKEFMSHLHVHQDGSCNGLQHYAALGLDTEAAEQVNLAQGEKPGDVYTAVAVRVQAKIDRDAAEGDEIAQKLVGKIKRKIVKQTVMTSVYGVTFIGAKDQIAKQLEELKVVPDEAVKESARYVATLTLEAIADLFSGAHKIKAWLVDCAGKIAKEGNPVCWITPLGIPIVQPYAGSLADKAEKEEQNEQVSSR
jgi:DNA-directed RNA polymerase